MKGHRIQYFLLRLLKFLDSINRSYVSFFTYRCVRCNDIVRTHWGHVHFRNMVVLAGHCNKCRDIPTGETDCIGCFGEWKPEYGLKIEIHYFKKGLKHKGTQLVNKE